MAPPAAAAGRDRRRIAFSASGAPQAQAALEALQRRYGRLPAAEAAVLVVLGGDGWMLRSLHAGLEGGREGGAAGAIPVYGMNCGSVGFLMNAYREDGLVGRLQRCVEARIRPLRVRLHLLDGSSADVLAVNEVSLLRSSHQAARIRIRIDARTRLEELICDGVLLATPAGSTAYNLSVQGPILPLHAPLLALTPISAFRPRRWRGALLPEQAQVRLDVLEARERPVQAAADYREFAGVASVEASCARDKELRLLFDSEHPWEERILREQFQF